MILGLLVWILDAWVGWMLYPEASFWELLVEPDPFRTLFMRSVVVLLIFLFGLYCGSLFLRLEKVMEREGHLKNVYGIFSRFNRAMLENASPDQLAENACETLAGQPFFPESRVLLFRKESAGFHVASSRGQGHAGELMRLLNSQAGLAGVGLDQREALEFSPSLTALLDLPSDGEKIIQAPLTWDACSFGWLVVGLRPDVGDLEKKGFEKLLYELAMDLAFGLKRLEDVNELLRSRRELERSEQRLRDLYLNASVGIFRTTFEGKLLFINPAMARALGCETVEEALGTFANVSDIYVDPMQRMEILQKLLNDGKLEYVDIQIRRKDGSVGWLRLDAHLTDADGPDRVLEGFARDVSEQKIAEFERMELLERLHRARKMESIGSLAGGFAHEFNNILQAMTGSAYLAELMAGGSENLVGHLKDIQNSGSRAARLCDQMLTFAGKKPVLLRWIRPDDLIVQGLTALEQKLPEGVSLRLELKGELAGMQGDVSMFRQMLSNLVDNAAEAIKDPAGEIVLRSRMVRLEKERLVKLTPPSERPSGDYYELSVEDSGCGMGVEVLNRIFDPFYSTKFQGRGLGLASVLGMVQSFRGGVEVESSPGKGSLFRFFFPCKEMPAERKEATQRITVDTQGITQAGRSNLIWIVDDEPMIGQTMSRILQGWGFETASALDAGQFLPKFSTSREQTLCVLLDLTLPGMSGTEIHAEIKLLDPDLPVIMMSGYSQEQTEAQLDTDQIAGFLHKPFTADSLRKVLEGILSPEHWPKRKG